MAQGSAPCSGYVLEATEKNLAKLGHTSETLRKYLIEHCDCEECAQIKKVMEMPEKKLPLLIGSLLDVANGYLEQRLSGNKMVEDIEELIYHYHESSLSLKVTVDGKEVEVGVYYYDSEDGDRYDELHENCWLIFNESDLYVKQESEVMKSLKESEVEPEYRLWTHFG